MQFYKEMDVFKQSKESEYASLKKKFTEFLSRYKIAMKKMATLKIHTIAMDRKKPSKREKSLESL